MIEHNYLLDTSAWIEYFNGTDRGKNVDAIISDAKNRIFISSIVVSEITSKILRSNQHDGPVNLVKAIRGLSSIIELDADIAFRAGEIHARERKHNKTFGMMDAIIWASAESIGAVIVTCDHHFSSIKGVVMLE